MIKVTMMELTKIDLPLPVVPAIKMCGNSSKSANIVSPLIFLPKATANGCFLTSGKSL